MFNEKKGHYIQILLGFAYTFCVFLLKAVKVCAFLTLLFACRIVICVPSYSYSFKLNKK